MAFVSTEAETDQPEVELKPRIDLLGPVEKTFFDIYDRYEPTNRDKNDKCFVSTSYDATTHFESTVEDVISMYSQITGRALDLSVDLGAASAAAEDGNSYMLRLSDNRNIFIITPSSWLFFMWV